MERESLLSLLIMLFGGLLLQLFAAWPSTLRRGESMRDVERINWLRLWYPVVPTLVVAAWLSGWALREPDPVPDPLDRWVVLALSTPFVVLFLRAAVRAVWSLLRKPGDSGVSTVGLIQPQVVFPPFLAKQLEDGVIRAALMHEWAHARHRDPLRIWLAQLITDLQWPWPQAEKRLALWLEALELARDEEARAAGADGAELAAAIVASIRFLGAPRPITMQPRACLNDDQSVRALRIRLSRLLAPLPAAAGRGSGRVRRLQRAALLLIPLLMTALLLGVAFGERVVHPLLAMTS
ncbi:MAG: hypothetical protein KGL92_05250 [Gammaproteobacteria bacterium]|nr:hypothetical protein [Gammaproteobacteria bacterium]